MKILGILKSRRQKQFVSEIDFITNLGRQSHLAIETLVSLREFNVEEEDAYKIDFCFGTDSLEKSLELIKELHAQEYTAVHEAVVGNKKRFLIHGQTTAVKMMHETLKKWATDMCKLGYACDCNLEQWKILL